MEIYKPSATLFLDNRKATAQGFDGRRVKYQHYAEYIRKKILKQIQADR